MTEDKKSGRELLEDVLRDTAEDEDQPQDVRMRAALALADDALEVAHQVHAEIAPRRHRRRPQPGRVIGPTGRLGKAVETALDQYRLQTVVKHMTRRARHLRPAYHQVPLTILLLSHRHQRIPRSNQNVKESDQAACVQSDFVKERLTERSMMGAGVSTGK